MEKVLLVSECPVDLQFVPIEPGVLLFEYLRNCYPGRSLAEDIALLITKGGTQEASPHGEMFRQTWSQIARTRVVPGTFDESSPYRCCFDKQHADGPALLVDSNLSLYEIIGEMWQLVGPSYRDIWAAYAQSLKAENTQDIF